MSKTKSLVMYPERRTLYLKAKDGRISEFNANGETARSWVSGRWRDSTEWKRKKLWWKWKEAGIFKFAGDSEIAMEATG